MQCDIYTKKFVFKITEVVYIRKLCREKSGKASLRTWRLLGQGIKGKNNHEDILSMPKVCSFRYFRLASKVWDTKY